jgi:serine/threonine-protein kinase
VEPGRILTDRYEILRPIAEGASSTVWEARDTTSGETVAVKAVSMEQAGWRAEVRDRFQQEARLLERVRHEHLVGVRDFGETDDGFLYLVLDRLSGETLADRIARPPRPSWREAAAIALELADGLAALHAQGIIHRDLKPANVILHDARGAEPTACKIIDLGISKASAAAADPVLFATLTTTGQVLGTPEYMSHEQALGERDVDARCDVWALGVVLYEMLAGRRPFEGQNTNVVLAAIRRGAPPPLTEVARDTPAALARVVERCLTRERDARFRDGEALHAALAEAVARGEAEARRAGMRRKLLLAAGAALAVTLAVVAMRALRGRAEPAMVTTATTIAPRDTATATAEPARAPEAASATPTATLTASAAPPVPSARPLPAKGVRPVTQVNSAGF